MYAMKTEVSQATEICQSLSVEDFLPSNINNEDEKKKKINRNNIMHQFVNRVPIGGPSVAREQQQGIDKEEVTQGSNYLYMPYGLQR